MKNNIIPSSNFLNQQSNWLKIFITIFLLIAIIASSSACSSQPVRKIGEFGHKIILIPGQEFSLNDNELIIRFLEIVNDSRCPTDVQCIWAGEVSVKVEIEYQGQTKSMIMTQSGSNESDTQILNFKISFDIQPYPIDEKQLKPDEYRLSLIVTQNS